MNNQFKTYRIIVSVAAGILLAPIFLRADAVSQQTARTSPAWLRDGVIYEIFPRDFSPAGDLNGVTAQLDRLKDLGVTILWTMPIQPIGEKFRKDDYGSPYSIKDYYAVDPNYGTVDDYKRLVSEAHKRGMKIIMDLVANHTAWDSVMTTNKAFYKQDGHGNIISPEPDWSDVAGLNYANPQLRQYMITMMKYWLQTCDIDGFRCDVAWGVPKDFWEQARANLEKIKPDIMMLAEANKPELLTYAFDIDYSWPLLHTLNDVLQRGAPASNLEATWQDMRRQFPQNSLHMRISDDHDESRAVARYGLNGALAASALMFTLDGVPLIYNGMEVGDATESGDPALFYKLPIFWSPKDRPPLCEIYHSLIELRKQNPAFCNNRVIWLRNSDETNLVTIMRSDDKDEFVVVINFSNRPVSGSVEVQNSGQFNAVQILGMPQVSDGDFPFFHLGAFEWRIYHRTVHH
jgi:cyclomaltodextrinase